jgi:hypothetical protein
MTVYNLATAGDVRLGVYVNDGVKWLRQADSELDFAVLSDSIINYITQNFSTTALGDSISYYITQNFETLNLDDTIMQFITNNLDNSALMDSVANFISNNNAYLTQLIDNIAQNVYQTTLGDSIVNYITSQISNTLLGDSILQYITDNITNTVLGDSIINIVHNNELDGVVGNEVTDATDNGGLIRSGAGTELSPYTLGIAQGGVTTDKLADKSITFEKLADHTVMELGDTIANYITQNFTTTALGDSISYYITQNFEKLNLGDTIMQFITNNLDSSALMDSVANCISNNNAYLTQLIDNIAQNVYNTTLGDSIVNYISNQITNTLLGDSILQYITENITNTVLGDSIINIVHNSELDGVVGNEVTDAATGGGLVRSGAGTELSPYTLGIANNGVATLHLANNAVNSSKIADGSIATADLTDNAVTSAKIADGAITNADVNASAAIDLTKIALPDAAANNGKVLKSNGTTWIAGEDNNSDNNTTYLAGNGLALSGTTFSIGANQITGTMIADGTIGASDLSNMNASADQVLKWNGTTWSPASDLGITAETDGIIGNEVTNATANGGLTRSGAGTAVSPYTLGIAAGGVTTTHIADNAITSAKIADGAIVTANIADNAVTSAKIADGTITNADINASAAIDLTKIALPNAAANNGKVLKSNGTTWVAGDDNNSDNNTTYSAGNGLTLSGTTFSIGAGQVTGTMIADGTISASDLSNMNASSGQVLKWNGTTWSPASDLGITAETDGVTGNEVTNATANGGLTRSGAGTAASPYTLGIAAGGVTTTHITDNAVTTGKIADGAITNTDINASAGIALSKLALPDAAANSGKVLKSNGNAWVAGEDNNTVSNTTYSAGSGLTLSGTTFSIGTGQINSTMITDGTVSTSDIANNAVTSAKIADGTVANADINASAAIDLTKIALPNAAANNGKVLKSNGTAWVAGDDNNSDNNTTYSAGSGLTLSGTTFSIGTGQISSTMIADGTVSTADLANSAVTSDKIANATIKSEDLNSMGALEGNVLTFTNNSWLPKPLNLDGAVAFLGTNDETYSPIPAGTYSAGQVLSIFIKVDVPAEYSYYILIPYSSANAMFPAFASTIGSGVHSRHITFTKSTSYSSFNVKYLIFGVK